MAEKTWEGRGDKLTDARMSWLSGRAADDLRLGLHHYRLLAHVGRQNHRRGWLRLSQSELAELWQCSRQRLNAAIADLVAWGYLMKRSQEETGESFCTYKVRLDDPDDADEGVSRIGDTPRQNDAGGGVSRPGDTPSVPHRGQGCPAGETGVSRPGDTPSLFSVSTDYADNAEPPPTGSPPSSDVCVTGGKPEDEVLRELLEAEHGRHVVESYIRPLWGALRLPTGVDPVAFLAGIRDELAGVEPEVLERAVSMTRRGRTVWPSTAQAWKIANEAAGDVPLKRFEREHPAFRGWLAHYRATGRAFWARECEARGYVLERSAVPPVGTPKPGKAA